MRFLIIDDNPADRELAIRQLRKEFPNSEFVPAAQQKDFEEAIARADFDVVVTDYCLNWTDGLSILRAIKQQLPHIPVLMVTDSGSEEIAVAGMKSGLSDYLRKGHMNRLALAVKESLNKAGLPQGYEAALEQLRVSEERHRAISELASDYAYAYRVQPDGKLVREWMTEAFTRITGYTLEELDAPGGWNRFIHPDDTPILWQNRDRFLSGQPNVMELRIITKSGEVRWLRNYIRPVWGVAEGRVVRIYGASQDITERKRAEEALRATNETLRALVQASPLGIAILDPHGKVKMWSPAAEQIFGWSEPEVLGRPLPVIPEDKQDEFRANLKAMMQGKTVTGMERHRQKKDGSSIDISLWSAPLRDAKGHISGAMTVFADISERKRAEEKLRLSDSILQRVGTLVLVADAEGRVVYLNPSVKTILGYEPAELLGDGWWNLSRNDPLEREREKDHITRCARGEIPICETPYERVVKRRDGESRWILWQDAKGPDGLLIGVGHDITERKQAEEALRIKTEQLQAITEAMTAFLESGNWQAASALLLRGALSQTASGYGFVGVVVEGRALRILAHEGILWDATTNREFYEEALRAYRKVGYLEFTNFENLFGKVITSGRAVLSNDPSNDPRAGGLPLGHPPLHHFLGVPILWGTEVVGMIGVANRPGGYAAAEQAKLEILAQMAGVLYDSYRRLQREAALEEQLRQSQKMEAVGRLAGGVAHDFNNLLTAIIGYSEFLIESFGYNDPRRIDAEEIKKAGERAAALTRQLLAFGRKQVLQPRVLDLNTVLTDMEKLLRRLIGEDIDLLIVSGPELGGVKADPGQIEQVIMNLAVNARDAMPQGGKLVIETANVELDKTYTREKVSAALGRYVMLAISDNGCGMDKETRSHLFEPFFTTKEQGKGTGLGLATVYGIVKQSGGHIWVHSEPDRGTTFKIYLPRVEQAVERVEPALAEEPARGSETVLLVEDEEAVRALAHAVLKRNGYRVLEARNGSEAIMLCQRHTGPIHMIVTDVVMPGMNGRDLVNQLTALRPELKVLYMSGYTNNAIAQQEMLDRGTTFLQKPFTPDVLARRVRELLDAPQEA